MNYNKKTVADVDVAGKKVLLRCDFNVPQDKKTGAITSDKRIVAALPTIQYLLEHGAAVIACSHLGKPEPVFDKWVKKQTEKGKDPASLTEEKWQKSLKKLTLAPVAERLSELLGKEVKMAKDVVGESAQSLAASLQDGDVMLLENVRFHKEETKNDPEFSKKLASLADIFVNDAFGSAHRAHSSTTGVADYLPAVCGFLIQKEIEFIGGALANPKRPLVAILGGAKVSDKIGVITNLLDKCDTIIVGGGMAYTFMKALGYNIGNSLLEEDRIEDALNMMNTAKEKGVKFLIPVDNKVGKEYKPDTEAMIIDSDIIPDGWMGLDIGPKTQALFADAIKGSGTVIWNGPMGVSEWDNFAAGTIAVATAVADSGAISIIGGGDSAAAVQKLPGIVALNDK